MRILIAEDDAVSRRLLEATLVKWGYDVTAVEDGDAAADVMNGDDAPHMAVLDWMMPGRDGPDVCRGVRDRNDGGLFYLLLLTAKAQREDIVSGLAAGADDYVTKPFDRDELRARLEVGRRIVSLQDSLADRVDELENALAEVNKLRGLLPICMYCKKIREGEDYTRDLEAYFAELTDAQFSHGVCPDCYSKHVEPELDRL